MKMIIALMLLSTSAFAQQLPTGPLQFIKDKKTVNVSEDTVNPLNTVGLPISGTIVATNPSVSGNNAPIPLSSTLIGGSDGGQLRPLSATTSGGVNYLKVDTSGFISIGAATSALQTTGNSSLSSIDGKLTSVNVGTIPSIPTGSNNIGSITNVTGTVSLPTGAATSSNQTTANSSLSSIDGKLTSVTVGTLPSIPAGSNAIGSVSVSNFPATQPVSGTVTANAGTGTFQTNVTNSTLAVTQSGTWDINNISGTVSLPTGAATSALQTQISGQLPATLGAKTTTNSMAVNIASDQVVNVSSTAASTGSGSGAAATVSTVITLTAPANATGFVLMNLDTSTANVRYAIGRTASATLGQQLQPGRDSGFIPCSANVSLIAESGTQNYDIQWVIK